MRPRLQEQPYAGGYSLVDFLRDVAEDERFEHLDIVVAWGKRSGFELVDSSLRTLAARGARVRIIVGVDAGGATRQGLECAMEHATEPYVFHVRGRTFHPKLFVAHGGGAAAVLIGSSNLTRGGVAANFELGVGLDLDLALADDVAFFNSIQDYVDGLLRDEAVCLPLDVPLLERLLANPAFGISDEDVTASGAGCGSGGGDNPFGGSARPMRAAPRLGGSPTISSVGAAVTAGPRAAHRWFKRLPRSDAQRLRTGHPTGHLTLVAAGLPLDSGSYFRNSLFARAAWTVDASGREQAVLPFDVWVGESHWGVQELVIDYNPAFEADQGNRTSTLRWGPSLGSYLHNDADHTGDFVTVEQMGNGEYRLTIADEPKGPFVA